MLEGCTGSVSDVRVTSAMGASLRAGVSTAKDAVAQAAPRQTLSVSVEAPGLTIGWSISARMELSLPVWMVAGADEMGLPAASVTVVDATSRSPGIPSVIST